MFKPNRRDFLKILLSTPIAATLDVEKLLWIPEKTIIVLPPAVDVIDVDAIVWKSYLNHIYGGRAGGGKSEAMSRDIFKRLTENHPITIVGDDRDMNVPLIVNPKSKEYDDWDF